MRDRGQLGPCFWPWACALGCVVFCSLLGGEVGRVGIKDRLCYLSLPIGYHLSQLTPSSPPPT